MEGVVLDFSLNSRTGIARCQQGNRYQFALDDWKSSDLPKVGDRIDFQSIGDQAHEIYRIHASSNPYQAPNQAFQSGQAATTNALAVISLISGIVGLFIFGSLIAVICGHIARAQIRDSHGSQEGDGMALAGLITGYIGLAMTILFVVIWLLMLVGLAASGGHF